ncbi:uncharacterized protein LOC117807523 [Notolabrus celidotus]|uniref:uncharacterized protein LOC117807523 n=1 Tax=Notolabrus celidotus TaxID=1203425 RepID=UPI001490734D|nr:uncharacterized protein LOC117807523 [Notolabrus celidotus]
MMTALRCAVHLTFLFLGSLAQMTVLKSSVHIQQDSGLIRADVGDNVTLRCFYNETAIMFYWYKQSLGEKPKLMTTFYRHENSGVFVNEFKNSSRFRLDAGKGQNHLTIFNLVQSDSATYYCTGSYEYEFIFVEGATVNVKGSSVNSKVLVHQPGGSETLNCAVRTGTCDGEHSVYWFKDSEEPHPGLIYTSGGKKDQCERKPDSQTHTCVYNLPMKNQNPSDAGTYCAVVSCGRILFGEGKKLDKERESYSLVYFFFGALAFTTTLLVFLACATYSVYRRNCSRCSDSRSSASSTPNTRDNPDTDSIHYSTLRVQKANSRSTRHRDDDLSECVYSSVKQ